MVIESLKNLDDFHEAARLIEANDREGFIIVASRYGYDVALLLSIAFVRRQSNAALQKHEQLHRKRINQKLRKRGILKPASS